MRPLVSACAPTYHLFPLYFNPKLQATIPKELLPRKQGKTCFNFRRPDPALIAMLDTLTATAREHWSRQGLLTPGPVSPDQLAAAARAGGTDTDALARLGKSKSQAAAAKRAASLRKKPAARPAKSSRKRAK